MKNAKQNKENDKKKMTNCLLSKLIIRDYKYMAILNICVDDEPINKVFVYRQVIMFKNEGEHENENKNQKKENMKMIKNNKKKNINKKRTIREHEADEEHEVEEQQQREVE